MTSNIKRRADFGPLQSATMQAVYENDCTTAFGNNRSIVPEGYLFITCILLNKTNYFTFGDELGDLVFLAAISHPADRNGLPTSILCMENMRFRDWLSPANGTDSQEPERQHFCLFPTQDFLKSCETCDQISLLAGPLEFAGSLKIFIKFMLQSLHRDGDVFTKTLLGIGCDVVNTSAEDRGNGKAELSEEEKLALMGRGSGRLAGKPRIDYSFTAKVPIGAIDMTSLAKKDPPPKNAKTKTAIKEKVSKKDLPLPPPPPAQPNNPATKSSNSRKTKSELEQELAQLRKLQRVGGSSDLTSSQISSSSVAITSRQYENRTLVDKGTVPQAAPVATPVMDLVTNRDERAKEFDQSMKQAGQIFEFAKGYLGQVIQYTQSTRYVNINLID